MDASRLDGPGRGDRGAREPPLDPDGIRCATVEVLVIHSRGKGASHEAYDVQLGSGKAGISGAFG